MKALCLRGKADIRLDSVFGPGTKHPPDAIIKVTCCAICGSAIRRKRLIRAEDAEETGMPASLMQPTHA